MKFLYINIDGFSHSYFENLQKKGKAKVFESLAKKGILFENLQSGLVSITNPMQSAILCGGFSRLTHNFYQHYDCKSGEIVKHKRTFDTKNVADLFLEQGKVVASIHQFMLEDNPCVEGDETKAYIKCDHDRSNFRDKFKILNQVAKGERVKSGGKWITYDTFPDFLALYLDDVDSLGHNNPYGDFPKRNDFHERQRDIENILEEIQNHLKEFIKICKKRKIYKDLVILITTDHGMTPFFGKSRLSHLIETLNNGGVKTATVEERDETTEVVALPYTIEVSLYLCKDLSDEKKALIKKTVANLSYVMRIFEKEEMLKDFGFDQRGPEFLVCPKFGDHFYGKDIASITFGASHDSFHKTSQHIFGLVANGKLKREVRHEKTSVIQLMPSVLRDFFNLKFDETSLENIFLSKK